MRLKRRSADEIARARFSLCGIEFLQLLDSERSLLVAQNSYVQSQLEYVSSAIALCKAVGGDWERLIDRAVPAERLGLLSDIVISFKTMSS